MGKVIAVFDLEGTLFKPSRSFVREITKVRAGGITSAVQASIFNISFMMIYIFYKIHLVGGQAMRTAIAKRLGSEFSDVTITSANPTRFFLEVFVDVVDFQH